MWNRPKDEPLQITVYRAGEDFQYVTMHINDWNKVLRALKKQVNTKWEVKSEH